MKLALISFLKAACFAGLLVHAPAAEAQETPPPNIDPYHDIKDPLFHDALSKLRDFRTLPPIEVLPYSPEYMTIGLALSKFFSDQEASRAMLTVLDEAEKPGFDKLPAPVRNGVIGAVGMAVGSGKIEFVPALKRLAHHPDPKIRGAVANYDVNRYAPSNSLGVLNESILGAIDYLPREASGSEEFRARWDEFELAVGLYSEFATPSQRDEIRPLVGKTLKRYGLRFAKFYRPRLDEALSAENRTIVKTMRGKDLVVEAKRNEAAIAAERNRKTVSEVLLWGSVILAPLGLIWLMIWKRRRRNRV